MRRLIVAFCFFFAVVVHGDTSKVLVPIVPSIFGPTPGAYGSLWTAVLVARNHSDTAVDVAAGGGCAIPEGCGTTHGPQTTFAPYIATANPNAGLFVFISEPDAISFELRVQDLSRQAETWGTSIPVVRETDTFTTTLQLLDVTVDSKFRSALRVYAFELAPLSEEPKVRVRIYDMCGIGVLDAQCSDVPLVDAQLDLPFVDDRILPESAMIADLVAAFPQVASVPAVITGSGPARPPAVRIEIDPINPGLRFWAFATVTNNATQHVTAITPN
ncbi:MAG TPA: hypothetical protein VKU62_08410 [Thermoanaerobaculia bacterium]|nr:hypothetical protein [Thermoanaerobaculia bacterium]